MLQTTLEQVTPAIAREWLKSNSVNRPLRPSVVAFYRSMLERGEYQTTHQGVAFSDTGMLLDGQHRLRAIAEMPEPFSLTIMVTRGLSGKAFCALDQGLRRTASDILNMPTSQVAIARTLAEYAGHKKGSLSPLLLLPFAQGIQEEYEFLIGICATSQKLWGSSDVRAAAILQLFAGSDRDYVGLTYRALNLIEVDMLSPAALSLYRQAVMAKTARAREGLLLRAFKAFNSAEMTVTKVQIKDPQFLTLRIREIVRRKFGALCVESAPKESRSSPRAAPAQVALSP